MGVGVGVGAGAGAGAGVGVGVGRVEVAEGAEGAAVALPQTTSLHPPRKRRQLPMQAREGHAAEAVVRSEAKAAAPGTETAPTRASSGAS